MRLSQIQRDRKRSEGGVWRDYISGEILDAPAPKRLCLLIAEAGNPRFQDAFVEAQQRHIKDLSGTDPEKAKAALQLAYDAAMAETVLLGWHELTDDQDQQIAYTPEKARELLSDPDNWQLRKACIEFSRDADGYRKRQEAHALGN